MKKLLALLSIIFLIILYYFAITISSSSEEVGILLAYVAGLTMIVLPCTFPLVFVIVPLTLGKEYKKGIIMALLFGLGLTITISIYGILTAKVGEFLGLDQFTRVMFSFAGIISYVFGFSMLGFIPKNLIPSLTVSTPSFILKQKDYLRAFLMGLFLGNAGVGCPNPAFYVLLTYIASTGSIVEGFSLGFIHGLGRATPLIILAILGVLGYNALGFLKNNRDKIESITGWILILFGAFVLNYGLFGMSFWEESFIHQGWNEVVRSLVPSIAEEESHEVLEGAVSSDPFIPWIIIAIMFAIPLFIRFARRMRK